MTRIFGIDVSVWDGVVDFAKAKNSGASFVYIKASQQVADAKFAVNWKAAKGILPRGAYHYLDWRKSELDQANLFVSTMGGDWGELPPVLDLEMDPTNYGMNVAIVRGKIWNFLTAVEKSTGRIPMLYTGYYYWNQWGSKDAGWLHFPFWLAWYAAESIIKVPLPWTKWTFWQYTDRADGHLFGCQSAGVDLSYFNGTIDQLNQFAPVPVVAPLECPWCGHALDPLHWSYKP